MAVSTIKVNGIFNNATQVASSYTNPAEIPSANMVGVASALNITSRAYAEIGNVNDVLATNMKVWRSGQAYAILRNVKKITMTRNGAFKSVMSIAQDGQGFYSSSWAGSDGALPVANSPDFIDVTFPCAGKYKINFQADSIYEAGSGYGAHLYFKGGLDARTIREAGYVYCYYGLRLADLNGTVLKWIGLPNGKPTRQYANDVYNFEITQAWFDTYGPTFRIGCFLMSSNGDYWRLHGTRVTGARIFIEFA